RYTLRYDLADVVDVDQDQAVVGVPWAPGRHRAAVEFVGKAVSREETNQDSAGLAVLRYWTGTARSGELPLVLRAQPEGKEAPGGGGARGGVRGGRGGRRLWEPARRQVWRHRRGGRRRDGSGVNAFVSPLAFAPGAYPGHRAAGGDGTAVGPGPGRPARSE